MSRILIPAIGVALLAASGYLYAVQTGHTRDPQVMAEAARRLEAARQIALPGWRSQQIDFTEVQLNRAEAAGGGTVRYRKKDPAAAGLGMTVMLLCGPHGPISVHPPTACFQGVGYQQLGPRRQEEIRAADGTLLGTFWVTEFKQVRNGEVERIRTWWAWSTDGTWRAPQIPRLVFAGVPVLYKLYLIERIEPGSSTGEKPDQSARGDVPAFARQYLPRLKRKIDQGEAASSGDRREG